MVSTGLTKLTVVGLNVYASLTVSFTREKNSLSLYTLLLAETAVANFLSVARRFTAAFESSAASISTTALLYPLPPYAPLSNGLTSISSSPAAPPSYVSLPPL